MFEHPKVKPLLDALHTENHFLPIISCFLISLSFIYLGERFTYDPTLFIDNLKSNDNQTFDHKTDNQTSTNNRTSNAPDLIIRTKEKAQNIFNQIENVAERVGVLKIVFYTIIIIISGTFLLLFLVRNNHIKFIRYWFVIAYFLVLFVFHFLLLKAIFKTDKFVIDSITVILFLWNFSILGVNCVLYQGPIICYKVTILYVSVIFSCVLFIFFKLNICWILILIITIWDFIAVLTPHGPLKQLAEIDNNPNATVLNAIVYSNNQQQTKEDSKEDLKIEYKSDGSKIENKGKDLKSKSESTSDEKIAEKKYTSRELLAQIKKMKKYLNLKSDIDEEVLRKLMGSSLEMINECSIGLGDFVFFTLQIILIAEFSKNLFMIFCSMLLILFGLFVTIYILNCTSSALPALPIPICICQFCFVLMHYLVKDKAEIINSKLIFI